MTCIVHIEPTILSVSSRFPCPSIKVPTVHYEVVGHCPFDMCVVWSEASSIFPVGQFSSFREKIISWPPAYHMLGQVYSVSCSPRAHLVVTFMATHTRGVTYMRSDTCLHTREVISGSPTSHMLGQVYSASSSPNDHLVITFMATHTRGVPYTRSDTCLHTREVIQVPVHEG